MIGLYELLLRKEILKSIIMERLDEHLSSTTSIYEEKVARRIFEQVKERGYILSCFKISCTFYRQFSKKVLHLAEHLEWLVSNINNIEPSILLKIRSKMKISQYLMNRYSRLEKKEEIQMKFVTSLIIVEISKTFMNCLHI